MLADILQGKRLNPDAPVTSEYIWYDRHSPYISTPRAEAEEEILALSHSFPSAVLNLSGLWGGPRSPKNWVGKVAASKEALRDKVCHALNRHSMILGKSLQGEHSPYSRDGRRPCYSGRTSRLRQSSRAAVDH